jgi:hypothetical protein
MVVCLRDSATHQLLRCEHLAWFAVDCGASQSPCGRFCASLMHSHVPDTHSRLAANRLSTATNRPKPP